MLLTSRGVARRWCCAAVCFIALQTAPLRALGQSSNFDEAAAKAAAAREAGNPDEAIRYYAEAVRLRSQWEEGWWYLGSLLYDADRFSDAVAPFHRVTELDPKLGPAWGFLGLCEFELGRNAESLEHLQRAEELGFAENPQLQKVVLYHLALLLNATGEFDQSSQLLVSEFASGRIPDQIRVAMGLALLRIPLLPARLDPSNDALVHAAGETAAFLAEKNFDAALANLSDMAGSYSDVPYLHYAYGNALAAAGRTEQAEHEFHEEIRLHPKTPLPWIALASIALKQNRPTDAVAAAKQAASIEPENAAVHGVLADAYQALGKNDSARTERAQQAKLSQKPAEIELAQVTRYSIRVDHRDGSATPAAGTPTPAAGLDFEAAVHQGEAAQQAGRLDEAVKYYETALQIRPEWNDAWRRLGTIAYMESHFAEAAAALEKAVKADAKRADAWTLLGLSEFELKDYRNSLLHLERASELGFGGNEAASKYAAYHLAILLNLNRRFDQAIDTLIPEVGPGPMESDIQFALGLSILRIPSLPAEVDGDRRPLVSKAGVAAALLAQRHYDQAFAAFDAMLPEYPNTPFLHYAYGAALANISEFDRSQVQLREEIRINPESPLPYIRLASVLLTVHHPEDAMNLAKKAVLLAPNSPDSHYVLGRAMLEVEENENAVKELETARALAPGSAAVHFNLARAYTRVHRTADAERERSEFQRLNQIMNGQSPSQRTETGLSRASEGAPGASTPAQ